LQVVDVLLSMINARKWVFVSLGDMSGTERFGEDGDPTDLYRRLRRTFAKFYFVDGNHDRPSAVAFVLRNRDGTACSLQMGAGELSGRPLAGVPGIMGRLDRPGRLSQPVFESNVRAALATPGLDTFVTHETPQLEAFRPPIGNATLTALVSAHPPRVHAFGHCHLEPPVVTAGGTTFINADRRVIMLQPR